MTRPPQKQCSSILESTSQRFFLENTPSAIRTEGGIEPLRRKAPRGLKPRPVTRPAHRCADSGCVFSSMQTYEAESFLGSYYKIFSTRTYMRAKKPPKQLLRCRLSGGAQASGQERPVRSGSAR